MAGKFSPRAVSLKMDVALTLLGAPICLKISFAIEFKSLLNNFIKAIVGLFVNILGGGSTIGHEDCNAGKKGHDDDLGAAAGLGCAARRSPAAVGQCKLTSR